MFCQSCGGKLKEGALFCASCGSAVAVQQGNTVSQQPPVQQSFQQQPTVQSSPAQSFAGYPPGYVPKKWKTALLLCIFLLCGHRFYTGKIGTAFLMMIPYVGLVWWIIDIIRIATGKFKDKNGYPLLKN